MAAEAALSAKQDCIRPMLEAFTQRHELVVARLNEIRGIKCLPAQGAFYAFLDVREAIMDQAGVSNDIEMAK